MAIATGQFTIIDYNDALTLTGYISSNRAKTQMYNQDNNTYVPDWKTQNVVLTPSLFRLGTDTDVISSAAVQEISWFDVTNGTEVAITNDANYAIGATKPKALTIKENVLAGLPGKDYLCKIKYKDQSTGLVLPYQMGISFSRVVNGSGIADAVSWAPEGNIFKNGNVATLIAACDFWRGSVIDTTLVSYQWYVQDPSITTDQGGGVGWRKLTEVANQTTGVTTTRMVVYPGAVPGFAVFKCVVKDLDPDSSSYNKSFMDTLTFVDQSDPIQVSITSTGGNIFKNGVGSTVLKALLFQGGEEIDIAGTKYSYKWFKYKETGELDANFGGTGVGYKTGKSLSVGDADVNIKATFRVEVS